MQDNVRMRFEKKNECNHFLIFNIFAFISYGRKLLNVRLLIEDCYTFNIIKLMIHTAKNSKDLTAVTTDSSKIKLHLCII
jgi:hypothetical protein